jgi:hypothetical protein
MFANGENLHQSPSNAEIRLATRLYIELLFIMRTFLLDATPSRRTIDHRHANAPATDQDWRAT